MGASHYIVLEKEIDGLDLLMDGKKLSRHIEALDAAARELGVRPLSGFFSMDGDALADVIGEDADDIELPAMEQFSAQEGLTTVRALLSTKEAQPAIEDLVACERILAAAAKHGSRWHFQIDV
jgi:hypothetical protein